MRIIGIDPGTICCGYGIIETGRGRPDYIHVTSGDIKLNAWEAGNLLTNDIETYSHNSRKIVIMDQQDNGSSQAIPFLFNNLSKSNPKILQYS